MPQLLDIECQLHSAGAPLTEYTDTDTTDHDLDALHPTKSNYVLAISGSPFSFSLSLLSAKALHTTCTRLAYRISLDGEVFRGSSSIPVGPPSHHVSQDYVDVFKGSEDVERRKLTFAGLTLSEDRPEQGRVRDDRVKDLGSVVVRVMRFRDNAVQGEGRNLDEDKNLDTGTALHEKALKGRDVSQRVGLGEPVKVKLGRPVIGQYVDTEQAPYATFIFHYRSERALKALGLIPRSPSPALVDVDDEGEDDELAAARRRVAELEARRNGRGVKREAEREEGRVKDERRRGKKVRVRGEEMECIDLTED